MASPNGAQIGFCFICLDRFDKVCTQTFCTSKSSCTNEGASKCVIFDPILVAMRNHQFPFSKGRNTRLNKILVILWSILLLPLVNTFWAVAISRAYFFWLTNGAVLATGSLQPMSVHNCSTASLFLLSLGQSLLIVPMWNSTYTHITHHTCYAYTRFWFLKLENITKWIHKG